MILLTRPTLNSVLTLPSVAFELLLWSVESSADACFFLNYFRATVIKTDCTSKPNVGMNMTLAYASYVTPKRAPKHTT